MCANVLFSLKPRSHAASQIVNFYTNSHLVTVRDGEQFLDLGLYKSGAADKTACCIVTMGRAGDIAMPVEWTAISRTHCAFLAEADNQGIMFFDNSSTASCQAYGDDNSRKLLSRGLRQAGGSSCRLRRIEIEVDQQNKAEFDIVWRYPSAELASALQAWREAELLRHPNMAETLPLPVIDEYANARQAADDDVPSQIDAADAARFVLQGGPIGHGGFGTVFRAFDAKTKGVVAVKVQKFHRSTLREMKIHEGLLHDNIVKFLGYTIDEPKSLMRIVMSLQDGSLENLVERRDRPLHIADQPLALRVYHDVLKGLDYLHSKGLIHRDVKPANVLYTFRDNHLSFRLGDFGLSNWEQGARTFCGTPQFAAPEIYKREQQTTAVDMWSLFMTIAWTLDLYGYRSLTCHDYSQQLQWVFALAENYWEYLYDVHELVVIDYTKRATAAQMLIKVFDGNGLTTQRINVPKLQPVAPPNKEDIQFGTYGVQERGLRDPSRANAQPRIVARPVPRPPTLRGDAVPVTVQMEQHPNLNPGGRGDEGNVVQEAINIELSTRERGAGETAAMKQPAVPALSVAGHRLGARAAVQKRKKTVLLKRGPLAGLENNTWLKKFSEMPGAFPEPSPSNLGGN
ncbi:CAMK kinase [Beauveria bassiana ARSEF 2860]|uniref:non-specific serine/threonine protein kinase n=1 Tax=Beauveria bassiana (strain ARSEF 2860) TaxID=655819 RepID=J4WAM4_BEAB2|nr:CAMK kinase [Beauveria bassiana ARSEF 2860]EJP67195.1 CAMK kinase [Beauveria bassiana ARSEF 2860]